MTEIQNPKQKIALNQFGIWSLRFIWNLMLEIWDFKEIRERLQN